MPSQGVVVPGLDALCGMIGGVTSLAEKFDELTIEQLQDRGSLKWTLFPGAIGAWVAEMDFGVADCVHDALMQMHERGLYGYTPPSVNAELREACANFQKERHGWEIDPGQVVVVPDVLSVLHQVIDCYLRPDSKIIVPTPNYMPFFTIPPAHGREVIQVPMLNTGDAYSMDLAGLEQAFVDGGELLILTNPHNPIGKVYTSEELLAIAEVVDRNGGLVFADEIHAPFVFSGSEHVCYAGLTEVTAAHTITATSASKAWNLAGLKCAQVVFTNPNHQRLWVAKIERHIGDAAMPGILANIAAYNRGAQWLAEVIEYVQGNRDFVVSELTTRIPGVKMIAPQGTYLAWVDCTALGYPNAQEHFLAAGVAMNDGITCGDVGEGFVRINLATGRKILEVLVERMVEAT